MKRPVVEHLGRAWAVCACLALLACEERKPKTDPTAGEAKAALGRVQGVTDTTIKLGSYGPLSGPAAAWGTVLKSMEAYFAFINDQGGIHGRKIEFVYRDDGYSPAKTPGVVRELVEKEQVFALVGGVGTANGRAVADYLEQKGVPHFTPSTGDASFGSGEKKNVYTAFLPYHVEGRILGEYIGSELSSLKVGVLYQDDDFGAQGADGLAKGLEKFGGKIAVKVSCLPTDTDLSGQVSQIASGAPEVLVIFAAPKQAIMAVKQLYAMKKKPHVLTSFVLADPIMFKLAGADVWEGTISSAATPLSDSDAPQVVKYREILEKYGEGKIPVGTFSMAGFAFAAPLVEALERAGKDLTTEKLYTAIQGLKDWDEAGPYIEGKAFSAPLTFGAGDHLGPDSLYLVRAEGGKWVQASEWMTFEGKPKKEAMP